MANHNIKSIFQEKVFLILIIFFLSPLGSGAGKAQEAGLSSELKKEILDSISQAINKHAYVYGVDFTRWKMVAAAQQAAFETARTEEEFAEKINAAFSQFGVSHLNLRTPKASAERRSGRTTRAGTSGLLKEDGYEIYTVRRGSPAETAGLQAGDIIVSADGKVVPVNGLSGTPGQRMELVVRRKGKTRKHFLEIKECTLSPNSLVWLNKQTAMISVRSFSDAHYDRKLIEKLFSEADSAKTIVIDLRGNGGGNADNVAHLLDMVLPSGTKVGTFIEKADVERFKNRFKREARDAMELVEIGEMTIYARSVSEADRERFRNQNQREPQSSAEMDKFVGPKSGKEYSGRVLAVTDRSNASGAEIFAQGIRDLKRGIVVGVQTDGYVLLGDTVNLPGKFELQLVVADYITVTGKRIEGIGIRPDVALNSEIVGSDKQLQRSLLKILKKSL